jgi:cysteine desulfurase
MYQGAIPAMRKTVYADNAATAALSKTALDAMLPYLTTEYGNPSSGYSIGRRAKKAIQIARQKVASAIGALPEEIFFTSGGTEAANWALKSAAKRSREIQRHFISTAVEHHAVLHTLESLQEQGCDSTLLKVDRFGQLTVKDLCSALTDSTVLISVMAANNEIGSVYPLAEIGAAALERGILFHTDAVQAVGHIPIDVRSMNIDLLSMAGHKFRGPKGVGALYIRKGVLLSPDLQGGGQEGNMRSGTENVAGIVGLGAALEEACANMNENSKRVSGLRDRLIRGLLQVPCVYLTGHPSNRLPGIASFVIEGVEGESMVTMLDLCGICASSGSACSSSSHEASHVLLATGLPPQLAHCSLRLSLNEENTQEDVEYILEKLPAIIARLRELSPAWNATKSEQIFLRRSIQ